MAQLLLAATVLAHALLVAHGNSGEFDGSGYGSGSGEPACHVPDPRPGLPGLNSRSDAILESRCHLACIEKVRRSCACCVNLLLWFVHIVGFCDL